MKNKGFTLLEMITVILIIGIISLIAVPIFNNIINDSKEGAYRSSMASIIKELENYIISNPEMDYSNQKDLSVLDIEITDKELYDGAFYKEDGFVILVDVTDGDFCANGNKNNLTIEKGDCN